MKIEVSREIWSQRLLATARQELGVSEDPAGSNRTMYGQWYGKTPQEFDGQPWCGMFTSWCFYQAGLQLGALQHSGYRGFASTVIGLEACRKMGWLVNTPQPGDIVFYDWDGDEQPQHVGIVSRVKRGGQIVSIEGNAGTPATHVRLLTRPRSVCLAFARPRFIADIPRQPPTDEKALTAEQKVDLTSVVCHAVAAGLDLGAELVLSPALQTTLEVAGEALERVDDRHKPEAQPPVDAPSAWEPCWKKGECPV